MAYVELMKSGANNGNLAAKEGQNNRSNAGTAMGFALSYAIWGSDMWKWGVPSGIPIMVCAAFGVLLGYSLVDDKTEEETRVEQTISEIVQSGAKGMLLGASIGLVSMGVPAFVCWWFLSVSGTIFFMATLIVISIGAILGFLRANDPRCSSAGESNAYFFAENDQTLHRVYRVRAKNFWLTRMFTISYSQELDKRDLFSNVTQLSATVKSHGGRTRGQRRLKRTQPGPASGTNVAGTARRSHVCRFRFPGNQAPSCRTSRRRETQGGIITISNPRTGNRMSESHSFIHRLSTALRVCFGSTHQKKDAPPPGKASRLFRILKRSIVFGFALSLALVLCFRWIPPCTSAVMIEERLERLFSGKKQRSIDYRWVDLEMISPNLMLAVIASEDQLFPHHWGFDFRSIRKALETQEKRGGRLRGASTITQQVAKNLFLWNGRSYVRKACEAYFAILLELLWPKSRILEVYLNIAEFGDGVYGVGAAAETYLRKSPLALTKRDAALLAAVLPNPKRFKVNQPSSYVRKRAYWIQRQMKQLGVGYLREM